MQVPRKEESIRASNNGEKKSIDQVKWDSDGKFHTQTIYKFADERSKCASVNVVNSGKAVHKKKITIPRNVGG